MTLHTSLHLYEELLLLILRDEEGTVAFGVHADHALAGGMLAELLLAGRIRVDDSRKRKLVELADATPLDDALLDEALERIAGAKRRASLTTWVSRLAGMRRLVPRAAQQLCRREILREDEGRILLIFKRKIFPEVDPAPERALIQRIERAIFGTEVEVDSRTAILISLARAADLLRFLFGKAELKTRRDRIEQIVNGDLSGRATKEAIEAMQAAVMVAAIMPAIMVATIASS